MENKLQNKDIKKHVATVHCVNNLTLLQRKISNVLLYNAYMGLDSQEVHTIKIAELCRIMGFNSRNYDAIKDALSGLISTVIEWNVIDEKTLNEDWTASSVLASARIKAGECEYSYSPHMRKFLHSPAIYAQINLVIQARFSSSYGLALYENCARYRNLPHTKWFSLDDFRKLMGVKEGEYIIFRDFKRRVLDKAIEEVNALSDILVVPDIKRVGRKVSEIRFLIQQRPKKIRLGIDTIKIKNENENSEQQILIHRMVNDFGLFRNTAETLVNEFTPEYIEEKMTLVLTSSAYAKGEVKGLAGYLLKAIKENYVKPISSTELRAQQLKEQLLEEQKQREHLAYKRKLEEEYHKYQEKNFYEFVNHLNTEILEEILNEWWQYCSIHFALNYKRLKEAYDAKRFESKVFRGHFKSFIQKCHLGLYKELSFDEFRATQIQDVVEASVEH